MFSYTRKKVIIIKVTIDPTPFLNGSGRLNVI